MTKYIMYFLWEPLGDKCYYQIKGTDPNAKDRVLNNGRPWLCKDASGLTGFVGMEVEGETPDEAKETMLTALKTLKLAKMEPMVWQ